MINWWKCYFKDICNGLLWKIKLCNQMIGNVLLRMSYFWKCIKFNYWIDLCGNTTWIYWTTLKMHYLYKHRLPRTKIEKWMLISDSCVDLCLVQKKNKKSETCTLIEEMLQRWYCDQWWQYMQAFFHLKPTFGWICVHKNVKFTPLTQYWSMLFTDDVFFGGVQIYLT